MPQNENQQFIDDFKQDYKPEDLFAEPKVEEKKEEDIDPEKVDEELKNRRHRKLEEKLQKEREANIALNARLQAISEANKAVAEPSEYVKTIEKIYGTDSPEAQAATTLLSQALKGVEESSTKKALELFREEQRLLKEQEAKEEERLDSMIDDIEDEYNVSVTKEAKQGFFRMLEKMSPKDQHGNVTEYADPKAVWEIYSERIKKNTDTRAKDLASRAMTPSGAEKQTTLQDDSMTRFLKENGII